MKEYFLSFTTVPLLVRKQFAHNDYLKHWHRTNKVEMRVAVEKYAGFVEKYLRFSE